MKYKLENDALVSEYHQYLDCLKKSRRTAMINAAPFLESAFDISIGEATSILKDWLENNMGVKNA